MKLKEFLNSELVSLPKGGFDDAKETFAHFVETLLEQYLDGLRSLDDPDFPEINAVQLVLVNTAEALAASIVKASQDSLRGHGHAAYQEISKELSKIDWDNAPHPKTEAKI